MLIAGIAAGLIIRFIILVGTFGTTDVLLYSTYARLADEHGVAGAYDHSPYINIPPLILAGAMQLHRLSERTGLAFGDLFRFFQILADLGTALCLFYLGRRLGLRPVLITLLFFLSPAAIFISAFHCNADPTMIFLVLLALALATAHEGPGARSAPLLPAERSQWAGVVVAIAMGIKIVPLLLVPLFCVFLWRRAWRFLLGFALTAGVIFGIPAALGGGGLVRNVFGYRGLGNWWGIVSILTAISRWTENPGLHRAAQIFMAVSTILVGLLILALTFVLWRRLARDSGNRTLHLLGATGATLAALLFVAPGFGVQYLMWPLPFLPFIVAERQGAGIHALVSAFLAVVYTRWSGELLWWFGNSERAGATTDFMVYFGWVVWASLGYVAVTWTLRTRRG